MELQQADERFDIQCFDSFAWNQDNHRYGLIKFDAELLASKRRENEVVLTKTALLLNVSPSYDSPLTLLPIPII